MFRTTNRIRLRIDLALADGEGLTSVTQTRRPLLLPVAPATGNDRSRPSLLAPAYGLPLRSGSPHPFNP